MFPIGMSDGSDIIDLFYEVIAERIYSGKKIFILMQKLASMIFIMYPYLIIQS